MTPELAAARLFYEETLNLRLQTVQPDQLVFELGNGELHVFRCERPAPPAAHAVDAGTVVTFQVECLDTEMSRLKAAGVRFLHSQPNQNVAAQLMYAAFEAPGGNVHELVQRL